MKYYLISCLIILFMFISCKETLVNPPVNPSLSLDILMKYTWVYDSTAKLGYNPEYMTLKFSDKNVLNYSKTGYIDILNGNWESYMDSNKILIDFEKNYWKIIALNENEFSFIRQYDSLAITYRPLKMQTDSMQLMTNRIWLLIPYAGPGNPEIQKIKFNDDGTSRFSIYPTSAVDGAWFIDSIGVVRLQTSQSSFKIGLMRQLTQNELQLFNNFDKITREYRHIDTVYSFNYALLQLSTHNGWELNYATGDLNGTPDDTLTHSIMQKAFVFKFKGDFVELYDSSESAPQDLPWKLTNQDSRILLNPGSANEFWLDIIFLNQRRLYFKSLFESGTNKFFYAEYLR